VKELASFTKGHLIAPPDLPGEGKGKYGVCCDRDPFAKRTLPGNATCDCNGKPSIDWKTL